MSNRGYLDGRWDALLGRVDPARHSDDDDYAGGVASQRRMLAELEDRDRAERARMREALELAEREEARAMERIQEAAAITAMSDDTNDTTARSVMWAGSPWIPLGGDPHERLLRLAGQDRTVTVTRWGRTGRWTVEVSRVGGFSGDDFDAALTVAEQEMESER